MIFEVLKIDIHEKNKLGVDEKSARSYIKRGEKSKGPGREILKKSNAIYTLYSLFLNILYPSRIPLSRLNIN